MPMFQAKYYENRGNAKTIDIDPKIPVRAVGLLIRKSDNFIFGLRLEDSLGNPLLDFAWKKEDGNIQWFRQEIPPGKEIIGLYGNRLAGGGSSSWITSLGFIVWSPNPQASAS